MRKTPLLFAAFSVLALSTMAYADETPKAPQGKPAASARHNPAQTHQQGMQHGGQAMHDTMMKDHATGMKRQHTPAPPAPPAMKMGCCDNEMKAMPSDKPMPMNDDM